MSQHRACCCGGAPGTWDCFECDGCCYSTASVATIGWAFPDPPPEYSTWPAAVQAIYDAIRALSFAFNGYSLALGTWINPPASVGGFAFGLTPEAAPCSAVSPPDWHGVVQLDLGDGMSYATITDGMSGGWLVARTACCTSSGEVILLISHWNGSSYDYYTATGTLTITISNNRCCHWTAAAEAPAWDSGTTYAAGDLVDDGPVYVSLQNGNLNHDPPMSGEDEWWRVVSVCQPVDRDTCGEGQDMDCAEGEPEEPI